MYSELKTDGLPETIKDQADIAKFITYLIEVEDLNFHPDTPFEDYISYTDGSASYTLEECAIRNQLLDECFELVGDRVYNIGLDIFLPTILPPLTEAL